MGSKFGDKTTTMEIPPWLEDSLKPYITDAVKKGQAMSDAGWQWGMRNYDPTFGETMEGEPPTEPGSSDSYSGEVPGGYNNSGDAPPWKEPPSARYSGME